MDWTLYFEVLGLILGTLAVCGLLGWLFDTLYFG